MDSTHEQCYKAIFISDFVFLFFLLFVAVVVIDYRLMDKNEWLDSCFGLVWFGFSVIDVFFFLIRVFVVAVAVAAAGGGWIGKCN